MKILNYIDEERQFYEGETIEIPGNEEYSQSALIQSINCARLSKYMDAGAASDDIIGDFPYDNISKYRIRLEARATDIDVKNIELEPKDGSKEARISNMIATKVLQKKMRDINFGKTLNKITDTRPEYGGVLLKKTDEGIHVVPWENVITDMSTIMGGVIIERHYLTPSELKKMDWDNADEVIRTAAEKRKELAIKNKNNRGKEVETVAKTIEVWELHGQVTKEQYKEALEVFTDEEQDIEDGDDVTYVNAQIIVSPQAKDEDGDKMGIFMQVNEEGPLEETYRYNARNPFPGRGMGEGIPEELAEHQRWWNFYKTEEARAVVIGGKVVFVTDDGNVADTIFDEGIDHGTILKVGENKTLTQVNSIPNSVPLYQAIRGDIKESGDLNTNSFATALGSQEFANVPFKAQYLQDINSNSQFKQYYEEITNELVTPIIQDWLLPDALKEAAKADNIYEVFSKAELQLIDEFIVEKELTERRLKILFEEKRPTSPQEVEAMRIGIQTELDKMGNKRAIEGIRDFIKNDVLGNVVIHTSDEQKDKRVIFESYFNLLQIVGPQSKEGLATKGLIMDQMGISQDQLALYAQEAAALAQETPPASPDLDAKAITDNEKEAAVSV